MDRGYFGSSQATVLALKAITHNILNLQEIDQTVREFSVSLGNDKKLLKTDEQSVDIIEKIFNINNDILLKIDPQFQLDSDFTQVFSIEYIFHVEEPKQADKSPLSLKVKRNRIDQLEEYEITIKNKTITQQGMTMLACLLYTSPSPRD